MENKIKELKKRANIIIGDKKITTLINEKDIIEKVEKILNEVDESNYINYNKQLGEIEKYLNEKEETKTKETDMVFLTNLAKELREQQVRKTDITNPPLFIVSNELGENVYFLTRKALEDYCKYNLKNKHKIVEIPSERSVELTELLNIIKRNF